MAHIAPRLVPCVLLPDVLVCMGQGDVSALSHAHYVVRRPPCPSESHGIMCTEHIAWCAEGSAAEHTRCSGRMYCNLADRKGMMHCLRVWHRRPGAWHLRPRLRVGWGGVGWGFGWVVWGGPAPFGNVRVCGICVRVVLFASKRPPPQLTDSHLARAERSLSPCHHGQPSSIGNVCVHASSLYAQRTPRMQNSKPYAPLCKCTTTTTATAVLGGHATRALIVHRPRPKPGSACQRTGITNAHVMLPHARPSCMAGGGIALKQHTTHGPVCICLDLRRLMLLRPGRGGVEGATK